MRAAIYSWGRNEPISHLAADLPALQWAVVGSDEEFACVIAGASILITSNRAVSPAWRRALDAASKIGWIHFSSAGIERGLEVGFPDGVKVTNSTGIKATMVSEHAMMLLLAL